MGFHDSKLASIFLGGNSERNMDHGRGRYNKDTLMRSSLDGKRERQEKSKTHAIVNKTEGRRCRRRNAEQKGRNERKRLNSEISKNNVLVTSLMAEVMLKYQ